MRRQSVPSPKPLEPNRREVERPGGGGLPRGRYLGEDRGEVDAAMPRREGRQPPDRLLELPLASDAIAALRLVPRDRDVDEALVEVLLAGVCRPPGKLELLVRGEVLAPADQLEAGVKRARPRP